MYLGEGERAHSRTHSYATEVNGQVFGQFRHSGMKPIGNQVNNLLLRAQVRRTKLAVICHFNVGYEATKSDLICMLDRHHKEAPRS